MSVVLKKVRTTLLIVALSCVATLCWAGASQHINVTTFLREGPGKAYRVIDEVQTGQPVDVADCANSWCRVSFGRASGYVAQNAIENAHGALAKNPHCLVNREAGYHGSDEDVLCESRASR